VGVDEGTGAHRLRDGREAVDHDPPERADGGVCLAGAELWGQLSVPDGPLQVPDQLLVGLFVCLVVCRRGGGVWEAWVRWP
jgi:hypothetical protein